MTKKRSNVYKLSKGTYPKKFKACNLRGRCLQFGDRRYSDYTKHKDPTRKSSYIKRHRKRESWSNPRTAGFWAKNLLWNKKTLKSSIKDTERRHGIRIV